MTRGFQEKHKQNKTKSHRCTTTTTIYGDNYTRIPLHTKT